MNLRAAPKYVASLSEDSDLFLCNMWKFASQFRPDPGITRRDLEPRHGTSLCISEKFGCLILIPLPPTCYHCALSLFHASLEISVNTQEHSYDN